MAQAAESNDGEVGEHEYELTLLGQGVEIRRRLPESVALRVIALVMGGGPSAAVPSAPRPKSASGLTLGEFLHETNATRNPDRILAIAVYLIRHLGQSGVTKDELKSQFQIAGQALPANFARDFAWTVSNRWIAPSLDNPGEFFVTSTGIKAVEEGFGADVRKASKFKPRGRKRTTRRTKP